MNENKKLKEQLIKILNDSPYLDVLTKEDLEKACEDLIAKGVTIVSNKEKNKEESVLAQLPWQERTDIARNTKDLGLLAALAQDTDEDVRRAVAERGFGLDILVYDKHYFVKSAVAQLGYGIDILVADKDEYVREIANKWLDKRGLTLIQYENEKAFWYREACSKEYLEEYMMSQKIDEAIEHFWNDSVYGLEKEYGTDKEKYWNMHIDVATMFLDEFAVEHDLTLSEEELQEKIKSKRIDWEKYKRPNEQLSAYELIDIQNSQKTQFAISRYIEENKVDKSASKGQEK